MEGSAVGRSRSPFTEVNFRIRDNQNLFTLKSLAKSLDMQLKLAFQLPDSDLQTIQERLAAFEARQARLSAAVMGT
jgi:hypothetical protein